MPTLSEATDVRKMEERVPAQMLKDLFKLEICNRSCTLGEEGAQLFRR